MQQALGRRMVHKGLFLPSPTARSPLEEKRRQQLPWWSSGYDFMLPRQGAPGLIPGRGTGAYVRQLKSLHDPMKIRYPACHN